MGKKRSCRQTTDENIIHDEAVKLPKYKSVNIEKNVNEFGNVWGIGATKLNDIREILEKHLEMWANV